MANTIRNKTGDGKTVLYPIDFKLGYLRKEFVYVYTGKDYNNQLKYSWVSNSQIQLDEPVSTGTEFFIRRVIPRDKPINNFEEGAILAEANLDDSFLQPLMILEEIQDGYSVAEGEFIIKAMLNVDGNRITKVGDAVDPMDALNKKLFDAYKAIQLVKDNEQDGRLNDLEGSVQAGQLIYRRTTWTAKQDQTEFFPSTKFGGLLSLYVNGAHQIAGEAYESVDGRYIRTVPLDEGDRVVAIIGQEPKFLEDKQTDMRYTRHVWFPSTETSEYTVPYEFKQIFAVYINGSHQTYMSAFEYDVDLRKVTFAENLNAGDEVVIVTGNESEEMMGLAKSTVGEGEVIAEGSDDKRSLTSWMKSVKELLEHSIKATGALVARTLEDMFSDYHNVKNYGAVENEDSSAAIQAALNKGGHVVIPHGVYFAENLKITVPVIIENRGEIRLNPNVPNGTCLFHGDGVDDVKYLGGTLNGNEANQDDDVVTSLFYLTNTNRSTFRDALVKDHWCKELGTFPDGKRNHCVHLGDGYGNIVANVMLEEWSNEGIVLESCEHSRVDGVVTRSTFGETDGSRCKNYSSVQVSGSHNILEAVTTYNNGASAVGCDSTFSVVNNITIKKVRWHNGVNMGHTNKPASYSVLSNVTIEDLEDTQNANTAGVQLSNGTMYVRVVNLIVKNANKGMNSSSGGKHLTVSGATFIDCITAITVYDVETAKLDDVHTSGCTNGIQRAKETDVLTLSDVDLTGCTNKMIGAGVSGANTKIRNVTYDSSHVKQGNVVITNIVAGTSVRYNNPNIRSVSDVSISARQAITAQMFPYIHAVGDGYVDIRIAVNHSHGYASVWISIT